VPDAAETTVPTPPAADTKPTTNAEPAAVTTPAALTEAKPEVGGHAAGGHAHHAFDFDALNAAHNQPYPAVEWLHGKPVLVLDAASYAQQNFARLSEEPGFADAKPDATYQIWANETALARTYHGPAAPELAKAMTVARQDATLGALPRELAFFNQQTFWSTIALTLTALVLLVFARRKPGQHKPANRVQHIIESLVLFVRDDIVRPNIKHHPEVWTPYFASLFLALLACNLFGLFPLFATVTGNIAVNAAFASVSLFLMLFMGIKNNGPVGFWFKLIPVHWSWKPIDMFVYVLLAVLEWSSLIIRPAILAIRLFANMLAGHTVLLVFISLGFIIFSHDTSQVAMGGTMGVVGWVLAIAFYLLELLVALIQAYIFTLLSAVFIGACAHPEH
jgi:F-type H+-transporting ATPase subunit a